MAAIGKKYWTVWHSSENKGASCMTDCVGSAKPLKAFMFPGN